MKKQLYDNVSFKSSRLITKMYSTSFSIAVNILAPSIRDAIYSIYGFVRLADEIVDSFHDYNKEELLNDFEKEYYKSLNSGISLNPILNSFQHTVKKYNIQNELVQAFLGSMRMDLSKSIYSTTQEYNNYIYGSADVVGLMCLKVFVNGNEEKYNNLKESAMSLGSAFQKVNFLRDLKDDVYDLSRSYFPGIDLKTISAENKQLIIKEIEQDFEKAYIGILQLPNEAKFGVYTAYVYYKALLRKLKNTPSHQLIQKRIRVSDPVKIGLLAKSFFQLKLNLL